MNANDIQHGGDHYRNDQGVQHWDFVAANFGTAYLIGNATKYISRYKKKGGLLDLNKALHYVQKLREVRKDGAVEVTPFANRITVAAFCHANDIEALESDIILALCSQQPDQLAWACSAIEGMIERGQS